MILLLRISVVLLGYSIACFGAGVLALRILAGGKQVGRSSAGTELATAFILGQGLLASIWLLLALKGWFSPYIVAGITLACAVSGIVMARVRLVDFGRQIRSIWKELRSEPWGWQILAGLTLLLALAWATSLGRSMMGDAAAFYMVLPKVVAASHRLVPLPNTFESFTSIGLQGEMHYAALMALRSPDAAQLFSWPTILAGGVMLLALGRQIGMGRRGQWITLAAIFTSSAVIWLSGDGKTDLFAVAFGFAAYYWVIQIRNHPRQLALWLTGLFSGFAIVAKFSYLPVLAPGIFLLMIWAFQDDLKDRRQWKPALISIALGGLHISFGVLTATTLHLIKNGVLFHNPIAPFGMGTMGWADQVWFEPATTRHILLTYPLALTFGNYWAQYGNLSPLALAFLPLAFLLPRPRSLFTSPLSAVTLAAVAGVLAWVVVRPSVFSPRYILATLLLFLLLPARAAEYASRSEERPRWLTAGIMSSITVTALAVGLYFLNIVFLPTTTYQYLFGHLPECGRDSAYPNCSAMVAINQDAAPGDRVFLASYYRYWLRPDLLQCVNNANTPRDATSGDWLKFYQQGFRYLLLDASTHQTVIDKLNLSDPPDWLELVELYHEDYITVYRLDVINHPSPQLVICRRKSSSNFWEVSVP